MGKYSGGNREGNEAGLRRRGGPMRGRLPATGAPAPVMKPVKGVGRYSGRGYCPRCNHTKGRCICS